jgi:hypothetical protein
MFKGQSNAFLKCFMIFMNDFRWKKIVINKHKHFLQGEWPENTQIHKCRDML